MTSTYFTEIVIYGGEEMPRAEMILDLQRVAATWTDDPVRQRLLVDRYLQGHELAQRL